MDVVLHKRRRVNKSVMVQGMASHWTKLIEHATSHYLNQRWKTLLGLIYVSIFTSKLFHQHCWHIVDSYISQHRWSSYFRFGHTIHSLLCCTTIWFPQWTTCSAKNWENYLHTSHYLTYKLLLRLLLFRMFTDSSYQIKLYLLGTVLLGVFQGSTGAVKFIE